MVRITTAGVAALLGVAAAPASAPGASAGPSLVVTPEGAIINAPFAVTLNGAPVFAWDIAYGIVSGSSNYQSGDLNRSYYVVYTSTDELYFGSRYSLWYGN